MSQKFYVDSAGVPCAFAADGSQDHLILPGMAGPISDEALQAALNPPEPPVTVARLKEIVTHCRWAVETGGITLPGGVKVATGIDDQNRITTVVANARLAGLASVNFKATTGWVTLALTEVEAIAAAIALHVQTCFSAECAHHEAIDSIGLIEDPAERQAALDAYDEAKGWPS